MRFGEFPENSPDPSSEEFATDIGTTPNIFRDQEKDIRRFYKDIKIAAARKEPLAPFTQPVSDEELLQSEVQETISHKDVPRIVRRKLHEILSEQFGPESESAGFSMNKIEE